MNQEQSPSTAQPVELDYAKPVQKHGLFPWWGGLLCSAFAATGAGCTAYGMVNSGSDARTALAIGIGLLAFSVGLLLTFIYARR